MLTPKTEWWCWNKSPWKQHVTQQSLNLYTLPFLAPQIFICCPSLLLVSMVRTSGFTWYILIYWHFTRDTCLLKSIYLQLKYSHLSYLSYLPSPVLQICLRFNYWKTPETVGIADTKGCPVPSPPCACSGLLPMLVGTADTQDHTPALSPLPYWCFLLDSGAEKEKSIILQSRVAQLKGGSSGGNISTQVACRKSVVGKFGTEICSKQGIKVSPKILLKKPRTKIIHAV